MSWIWRHKIWWILAILLGGALYLWDVWDGSTEALAPGIPEEILAKHRASPPEDAGEAMVTHRDESLSNPLTGLGYNVVLVIGCTVRKDQTSLHGLDQPSTPYLETFAEQGVVFDDVITTAPWTKASTAGIISGFDAISIGMVERGLGRNHRVLAPEVVTLSDHLRSAGYRTLGLTTNPNTNKIFGFDQGFDAYRELSHLWRDGMIKIVGKDAVDLAFELVDEEKASQRPFFLQILLVDAHAPHWADNHELEPFESWGLPSKISKYRASIRRFDQSVKKLDLGLKERGFDSENTIFVVVNDHGEGMNWPDDHHGKSHGRYLLPSAVGGLWLMKGPHIQKNLRMDSMASHVDVVPTVLGLLNIDAYEKGPGLDMSKPIRGERPDTGRVYAYTDSWFLKANRSAVYTTDIMCQWNFAGKGSDGDTYFLNGCFHRLNDPNYETPIEGHPHIPALRAWRKARKAEYMAWGHTTDAELARGLQQQLEALGYVDPTDPEPID